MNETPVTKSRLPYPFGDLSLWFLLFSNLATMFFALTEGWNLLMLLWIYWAQSITIGIFNFIRILSLKEFSTENFTINDRSVEPTQATKKFTAFFFAFHFGFFHFIYSIFLAAGVPNLPGMRSLAVNGSDVKYIVLVSLLFFANHLFSYFYNRPKDTKKQNIGSLMFYPYARIIPIHLTILVGSAFTQTALPIFLVLKTVADAIMHIVEHYLKRGEEPVVSPGASSEF